MKSKIAFVILLGLFAFTGCKKENTDRPIMTAKISGDEWICTEPFAILSDDAIYLHGLSSNGITVEFTVLGNNIGSYNLDETDKHTGHLIPNQSKHAYIYTSDKNNALGQIRINKIDKDNMTISGTFQFKAWHPTDPIYEYVDHGKFENVPFSYLAH